MLNTTETKRMNALPADACRKEVMYFYIDRRNEAEEKYHDARETWLEACKDGTTVGVCQSLSRYMERYAKDVRNFEKLALSYGMFDGDLDLNATWR